MDLCAEDISTRSWDFNELLTVLLDSAQHIINNFPPFTSDTWFAPKDVSRINLSLYLQ